MPTLLIQAAINGDRSLSDHPNVPLTLDQIVDDCVQCVAAGARAIHMHPRDHSGKETLHPDIVNKVAQRVKEATNVPVGVTTGAWIEPDLTRRIEQIRRWTAPDYTSVNLSEIGSIEVMKTLTEVGIGIEAGVWTVADAELLITSGFASRVTRILIEPGEEQVGQDVAAALALVNDIHQVLDGAGVTAPRLQHGDGAVAWALLVDAFRRGIDTRIGLEDTLNEPDGTATAGNARLVTAAHRIRTRFLG